jgi:DNA-binding transcriptional regulator YdaS (Cro superfamily)
MVTPPEKLLLMYGTKSKAAKALGVTYETIRLWCIEGIPVGAALRVERATRGEITAEQIVKAARRKAA